MRRLLTYGTMIAILILAPVPAHACINDAGSKLHEEEFKSSYIDPSTESAALSFRNFVPGLQWLAGGAGAALAIAGMTFAFVAPRRAGGASTVDPNGPAT